MTTKTAMGPLPAAANCLCHICLPGGPDAPADAIDRQCVDTVHDAGWQVIAVGGAGSCSCCGDDADAEDDEPAFAYTVGLMHRADHPELAISGLSNELMHTVLNYVAAGVVAGHRLQPGDSIEGALGSVPLTVDLASRLAVDEIGIGSFSGWFHRRPVEALQLVWPATNGIFAWQPGGPGELDRAQPPSWRVPSRRVGGFAVDPAWTMPVPPDTPAITCVHVLEQGAPVLLVARHLPLETPGYDWQFSCGGEHGTGIDQLRTVHIAHAVRSSPSVRDVADLRVGQFAERVDAFSPWVRS